MKTRSMMKTPFQYAQESLEFFNGDRTRTIAALEGMKRTNGGMRVPGFTDEYIQAVIDEIVWRG